MEPYEPNLRELSEEEELSGEEEGVEQAATLTSKFKYLKEEGYNMPVRASKDRDVIS